MRRTLMVAAIVAAVLAVSAVAMASAPPTTSTTTTTTAPAPAQPTRGVIQCVPNTNSPWSEWLKMDARTTVTFNASIESGMPGYLNLRFRFSVDGVNPLPDPNASGLMTSASFQAATSITTMWPYVQLACSNTASGSPVLAWRIS
jgi:hypothetical protein